MTKTNMDLSELLQKHDQGDLLRSIAEAVLQLIMEADVDGLIGAGRHERSGERTTWRNGYGSIYDIDETVAGLAEISPIAFLNRAFAYGPPTIDLRGGIRAAPLSRIPPATLVGWCQSRRDDMWGRIAWSLKPFSGRRDEAVANDLPAQATALLDAAPDPIAVLEAYAGGIDLGSFTGSRAAAIETRLLALEMALSD